MTVEILPLPGIPEVQHGDDLGGLIADAAEPLALRDGDVVVVTQKVVSKAEGRLVPDRGDRDAWVARESRRVVARQGELVICETHHGFVCANAGVDASNVPAGFLSLLPADPDASAERVRAALTARTGVAVRVIVTDTFGRPWRRGLVNVAIGCAGMPPLVDLRGAADAAGRILRATVVAAADEVAAASGLVMGKADRVPAAIVRGFRPAAAADGTAAALVRPAEEDLFRYGPLTAISARRSVREFGPGRVPLQALHEAVAAALTAPVPHGSRHRTRPWRWILLRSPAARRRLLAAMAEAWRRDLREDGVDEGTIERRLARSDALLGRAPVIAVPLLSVAMADPYPDDRRREAERDMFVLATGAGVQNFMLALHAQGVASCWVSSTLFCRPETRAALQVEDEWEPMGAVAVGPSPGDPPPRSPLDPGRYLRAD
jgi:coenzyme F420-0:L-glutamate ligase/coenzyme F420-1:gamma-L-glutamate ligase